MTRVLVYSHDPHGLGHTRRMLAIAEHLVGHMPAISVLLVTDAPALDATPVSRQVDFMRLPSATRACAGESALPALRGEDDATVRMRSNLVLMATLDFAPDLVIVDHEPLGFGDELAATLDMVARRQQPPKVALLLRDVPDAPERAAAQWEVGGWHAAIARYYHRILVMGEREVCDVAEACAFPLASERLLQYCGTMERPVERGARVSARARFGLSPHERVVLAAADGTAEGTALVASYLEGLQQGSQRWHTLLALDPELPAGHREALMQLAGRAPHVICLRASKDLAEALHAADAVLATGGPGTACELLAHAKAAVIVPRTEALAEEWLRAERLQRFGRLRALHPRLLTVGTLMESVAAAVADGRVNRDDPALLPTPLARLQHALGGLLAQRAIAPYALGRRLPPPAAREPESSPLAVALLTLGRSLGLQPFTRSRAAARRAGGLA